MLPGGSPSSTARLQMVSAIPTAGTPASETMSPAPATLSSSDPVPTRFMMRVMRAGGLTCPAQ